jgi:hypothetical protein
MDWNHYDFTEAGYLGSYEICERDRTRAQQLLNRENLRYNMSQLPRDIIGKLYIYAMRKFWRKYVPKTAQVPTWYTRSVYVDKILWNSRYNNVHFLHLPFNIIPQNKKYIQGCLCYDCFKMKLYHTMYNTPIEWQYVPPISEWEFGEVVNGHELNYPGQKINVAYNSIPEKSLSYYIRHPEKYRFTFTDTSETDQ